MSNYKDLKHKNLVDTGTTGTKVAAGTTAQRGSTAGEWRYNITSGFYEGRNTDGSFSTLEPTPAVTSVDDTEVDSAAGGNQTFVITGTNFTSGGTISFVGTDASTFNASTTTHNSSTQQTAVVAKSSFINAKEPYDIKYTSATGKTATLENIINVDNDPTWNTASGNLGTISDQATGTHATLSATDPEGDTVTYSETGATNITGAGLALNSSTGVISGDPTDVSNTTTVSFTGRATANSKTTDRSFNIIIDPYRTVYFGILGAGGGGAGRQSTSYQGSGTVQGRGGAGSFVEAVYEIKLGTTVYTYVGHYGQSGQSGAGGSINTYGGNGQSGGNDDTSGEGGDFSGIFTANSVTQANALIIAGGGGGGSGRPHGAGGNNDAMCNGGGRIESTSTGEGNDGCRGNNTPTHSHGSDRGGQGGQQNGGGANGAASGSGNVAQAGSALQGGNGSTASGWGNGGGGGGGFFGGGGGTDDGSNWGGQGGGAGSSFARGGITNYSTSAFNSVTATGITYDSHTFRNAAWGYDGGTTNNSTDANVMYTTYNFSSFGSGNGTNGLGGRENSNYPGAGYDGGHGLVFYRVGSSGSYTRLTSTNTGGTLTSLTIS